MKIKRSQLKQIIKEEVKRVLIENEPNITHQWADERETGDEGFPGEMEAFMAEYPEQFPRNPQTGEFELSPEDWYTGYQGHPELQPPGAKDITDPNNPYGLSQHRQNFRDRVRSGELTAGGTPTAWLARDLQGEPERPDAEPATLIHIPERDCPPGGCRETNIPYPPPPEREEQ